MHINRTSHPHEREQEREIERDREIEASRIHKIERILTRKPVERATELLLAVHRTSQE